MLKATVNSAAVEAALGKLEKQAADLAPAFDAIGASIAENIRLGLRDGESPWGDPFAPLKELRSNNQDGRESDVPLNDTRKHIYDKINYKRVSDGVEVGMFEEQKIGATHQYGSRKNNIPARPFLPIRPDGSADLPATWEQEIIETIERHIKAAI